MTVAASATSLAGCSSLGGRSEPSRLDLTVQNERDDPVTAEVTVTGDDGVTYFEESDRIETGVARAFETPVGSEGRHEVTVTGGDWQGNLGWNAGTCALYDGRVRVSETEVAVSGECVDPR